MKGPLVSKPYGLPPNFWIGLRFARAGSSRSYYPGDLRAVEKSLTSCMNFLQTGLMSLERVALNIITCFSCGVARKISCTSRRMSEILTRLRIRTQIARTRFEGHSSTKKRLTQLLEHLVALVEDKVLQVLQRQLLGADQGQDPE